MGGAWSSGWRVKFQGEVNYDLMQAPVNWVKNWLKGVGIQNTIKKAAVRRPTMRGAEKYDATLHHSLNQKRTNQQTQDLLMIQAGGLWTAMNLQRAGFITSDICPHCRQQTEDLNHLWWECPHHEHRRKEVRCLLQRENVNLPTCTSLHGIPVQPSADLTGPIWENQENRQQPRETLPGDLHFAWMEVLQDLSLQNENELHNLTARQLGLQMQGDFGTLPTWERVQVSDEAPDQVTTYTDGAVFFNQQPHLSIGTWGLSRQGSKDEEVPNLLDDVSHTVQNDDIYIIGGHGAGPAISSTRQEALGFYAALAIQKPQNIGIDNKGVVLRGTKLLKTRGRSGKPWGLQDDGDVWENCLSS